MPNQTLGEVRIFAGTKPPTDWMFCDGSPMSVTANADLFAVIGTIYGGDGLKSFLLPDMRGRIMVGAGAGTGLSHYSPGQTGGRETVAMAAQAVPTHIHTVAAASSAANSLTPTGASFGTVIPAALLYTDTAKPTVTPRRPFSDRMVGPSGGSPAPEPHENMMPSVAINFIIAIKGVFPST